jgi:D-glycero-D-manno-heptose 1,7-bisphosphate phosphatase
MKQRAVFLDRDGTLVHPRHYPSSPKDLRLYNNIVPGLKDIQHAGLFLVVITNQSGIARGYFGRDDLQLMHDHLFKELEQSDVKLDAIYYCPHHPAGIIPELSIRCNCRKPQPGMLLQAAFDLDLDLQHSWFVGDILDDVEAGNRAGCRTVLVDLGTESLPEQHIRCPDYVAPDTQHALSIIIAIESHNPLSDLIYWPPAWQSASQQAKKSYEKCVVLHSDKLKGV